MKRYCLTGGDNGYCCRCGGLCDRSILEIDDDERTIRGIEADGICLGKWCWHSIPVGEGWFLKRYEKCSAGEFETYGGNKLYLVYIDEQGNETERRKVVVKGQKWGKDDEVMYSYNYQKRGKVVDNYELCEEELPTEEGFFFGSTDYDEWYLEDIDSTIEQLKKVVAEHKELIKAGVAEYDIDYYYRAWY